jgi:hypothetical protein
MGPVSRVTDHEVYILTTIIFKSYLMAPLGH